LLLKNAETILKMIGPGDVVLDIGGWGYPFNRANYVMDCESYETRGYYNRVFFTKNPLPPLGGAEERFGKQTWIQRDVCDREPFPFRDKEVDFVICSHTLEDIRDPIWVCSEMIRIGKRGYIEVPSRVLESCRGGERGIVGLAHHRWLIDIESNHISFLMKLHSLHSHWRYSLPPRVHDRLTEEQRVQWLFWENTFSFGERIIHGDASQLAELESFVKRHSPYPSWMAIVAHAEDFVWWVSKRVRRRLRSPA
jgi:hypothetical protein